MQCDQCGARRPRTGPCPNCGAPPPGTYSSMRQGRSREQDEPAPRRRGSGAGWDAGGGRRGSGAEWDVEEAPARSGRRNRRGGDVYDDEVDLERALVPMGGQMAPAMAGAGLPALPGYPASDEEERALGIRRPVYIPATQEKKVRPGTWRIVSGVLSVLLFCVASCGLAGFLGRSKVESWLQGPIKTRLTPPSYDYSVVPPQPTSTPGPSAKYVTKAVTCQALLPLTDQCSGPTTKFLLTVNNQGRYTVTVYVVATVQPIAQGQQHGVTVRWYLNGAYTGISKQTTETGKGSGVLLGAYFALVYPQPGIGMARVYWDLPSNDSGDSANDPHLAQTVIFGLYMPTPTPGTPTAPTRPTGTGTPAKATPTKGADVAPAPADWRRAGVSA